MQGHVLATKAHRWLAALIGIQILIWFGSGTIMAILPMEKVRGEHLLKKSDPVVLANKDLTGNTARVLAQLPRPPHKVEIYALAGRPVLRAEDSTGAALFDITTARQISPLPKATAISLVQAGSTKALPRATARWITEKSTDYRGDLPAWRVDGNDDEDARFYVDPTSGQIKPVRTGLWRIYDFIWGLHIMDWKNHSDTGSLLLSISGGLAVLAALAGIVLFVFRVLNPFRRRRARRRLQKNLS
jgi:hypothetical protein